MRVVVAVLFSLLCLSAAFAQLPPRGLGARPPTPSEQAYVDAIYQRVTSVAPNELAYARRAAELAARGVRATFNAGLPTAVDNSTLPYFPPIRSQGDQGSCTAWASAYYYNTYTQAKDEGFTVSGGDNAHICSPAFMYHLTNGGVDEGAYTPYVVSRLTDTGCSSWDVMPYSDTDFSTWPSTAAWVDALHNRTLGYYEVSGATADGRTAIKQLLANGRLVVTSFEVYSTWYNDYTLANTTGVNNGVYYAQDGSYSGGHAVTIVGYDDSRSYVDHRDGQTHYGAFLLANSWGTWWGLKNSTGAGTNGFFWVAYSMFTESTFGPYVYYTDDRGNYRPALYALVGVNHAARGRVVLEGNVITPPWESYYALWFDGGTALPVTDATPIAVDLTEGLPPSFTSLSVTADLYVQSGADATLTSASFFEDVDGDGKYRLRVSSSPTVTVTPGTWGSMPATVRLPTVASTGLYDPTTSKFYLRNSNTTGAADLTFQFGSKGCGWTPLVGDWNGDGIDTVGLFDPASSKFHLRNSNSAGAPDLVFQFGPRGRGWIPAIGDWNADGIDTVGLYDPVASRFYLRNANSAGVADTNFFFGSSNCGWTPVVGDWNEDGTETIGLYNPSTYRFYLRNSSTTGVADLQFSITSGVPGSLPVVGDWNADGTCSGGLRNPATASFLLRDATSTGAATTTFGFGSRSNPGWKPLAGDWNGL